jgi:hypothetical protein
MITGWPWIDGADARDLRGPRVRRVARHRAADHGDANDREVTRDAYHELAAPRRIVMTVV